MDYLKYSGAGNNFLILNNLDDKIVDRSQMTIDLISREQQRFDGVIYLEESDIADFKMNYYNRDGSGNALCGNGLRCTAQFINDNKISEKNDITIEAVTKIYPAKLQGNNIVTIGFYPPDKIKLKFKLKVHFTEWWQLINCSYIDVGSPHAVIFTDDIEKPVVKNISDIPIDEWGKNIRMHKDFAPEGVNAQFVQILSNENSEIAIRSFERGVEGETLACGTGAISSAIVSYALRGINPPVKVFTKSGSILTVDFSVIEKKIRNLTLTGPAVKID
ncbi:MAG: diaminopimelate epimerase [Ignavibacteria bacterium]|nr:diaminopimelate epimerase [Ignavibacteria bacterium]